MKYVLSKKKVTDVRGRISPNQTRETDVHAKYEVYSVNVLEEIVFAFVL